MPDNENLMPQHAVIKRARVLSRRLKFPVISVIQVDTTERYRQAMLLVPR